MTTARTKDSEGFEHISFEYNGFHYPRFRGIEERVRRIPNIQARNDDIFLCSYPKSGTNWILEIISMLQQKSTERKFFSNAESNLCYTDDHLLEALPSPRILNTHLIPELVPSDFLKKKCKIIQMRRNPKDLMVSYYNMEKDLFGVDIQCFSLDNVIYGSWFDYIKDWEEMFKTRDSDTYLVLYYEDMKRDLLGHIRRVVDFLGLDRTEDLCQEVADQCTFEAMKEGKTKVHPKVDNKFVKNGLSIFYRKGEVGDWKNWLTVAQSERYDAEYKKRMEGYEYLKFTYDA